MTEFISAQSSLYSALPYEKRPKTIAQIMKAVRRNAPLAVVVSMDEKDFHAATSHRFRSQMGTAYTICALSAVMLVGKLLEEEQIDWNVIWTFEHGQSNVDQLAQRLSVINQAAGKEFRIQRFGFSSPAPGVIPELPIQMADALAFACLQPARSFKTIQHLQDSEDSARILNLFHLDLSPSLIHRVWDPVALMEAKIRKQASIAKKAETAIRRMKLKDGTHEVEGEDLLALQAAVKKLNRQLGKLNIKGVSLVIEDSDVPS